MEEKELWMNKLKEKSGITRSRFLLPVGNNWKKNLCLLWRGRYILIVNGR